MRKSNLVKAMACFMAATMAITCVPSANVTNGVSIVAEAAEELKPAVELTFDGTDNETAYTENNLKFSKEGTVSIVANPDKATEKVLFTNGGYLTTEADALSEVDFTEGVTVSMDIRPEIQTTDWNYLFGIGYITTPGVDEFFIDGTVGFIQRIAAPYTACFPGDGWVEGNSVGNAFDYFLKEENCKKWYNLTYVYGKDKCSIYLDGILTVQSSITGKDAVFKNLNKGAFHIGCGIDPAKEHTPAYYDNIKVFNTALSGSQVAALNGTNACTAVSLKSDTKTPVVGVPFKLTAELTGEDTTKPVTDSVTHSAINADITIQKDSDGNEYILSITPKKAGDGSVTVTCGAIDGVGGKADTYKFTATTNKCTSLTSSLSTEINAQANQVLAFSVTATAANPAIELEDKIELVSGSSLEELKEEKVEGVGKTVRIVQKIALGRNVFGFKCGDQSLEVVVTGVNKGGSTSTTTPGTDTTPTPGDDTNTPNDTTNTPGDDTNTPNDTIPTPGDNNNTPSDTTNTPGSNNTSNDNNNTNSKTKKKAKVNAVKATKGKKVVSGTVKLSSGKVVKKATVKVYVNNKKKATVKTNNKGKFSVKLSKKLKKGDKVKLVITKTTIKKITKTVTVK